MLDRSCIKRSTQYTHTGAVTGTVNRITCSFLFSPFHCLLFCCRMSFSCLFHTCMLTAHEEASKKCLPTSVGIVRYMHRCVSTKHTSHIHTELVSRSSFAAVLLVKQPNISFPPHIHIVCNVGNSNID